tara:strand:- start:1743 stop:1898 length:156 start_codon:yes stop_codon:yes gene_type:complete
MIYVHFETAGRVYVYGPFDTETQAKAAADKVGLGDHVRIVETYMCHASELA